MRVSSALLASAAVAVPTGMRIRCKIICIRAIYELPERAPKPGRLLQVLHIVVEIMQLGPAIRRAATTVVLYMAIILLNGTR